MADLKLSDDGLFYWDGRQWVSTLSPDGRFRWSGSAWVPVAAMAPQAPNYQPPPVSRVPTPWTKPMQYAVAGLFILDGLYVLSLPFWMSGMMSKALSQAMQQQAAQNPYATPPPPEFMATITSIMSVTLWVGALIGLAICALIVVGALRRWTWMFYVVLVLLGLSTISLPYDVASALSRSSLINAYGFPSWWYWVSFATGIPFAALFVWMLIAVIRYGPWAMAKKVDEPAPATPAPAS